MSDGIETLKIMGVEAGVEGASTSAINLLAGFAEILASRKEKKAEVRDLGRSTIERVTPSLDGYEEDVHRLRVRQGAIK